MFQVSFPGIFCINWRWENTYDEGEEKYFFKKAVNVCHLIFRQYWWVKWKCSIIFLKDNLTENKFTCTTPKHLILLYSVLVPTRCSTEHPPSILITFQLVHICTVVVSRKITPCLCFVFAIIPNTQVRVRIPKQRTTVIQVVDQIFFALRNEFLFRVKGKYESSFSRITKNTWRIR